MKLKKIVKMSLAALLVFGTSVVLAGCNNDDTDPSVEVDQKKYAIYKLAKDAGETNLSYEEWLVSIKGEKGERGEKGEKGETGQTGEEGNPGKDGATWLTGTVEPTNSIGKVEDLYFDTATKKIYVKTTSGWVLKTTIVDGKDGEASTIEIKNNTWWIDGEDTGVKANAVDGETPKIIDGYWYIGEVPTNIKAEGVDGREVEFRKGSTHIEWKYTTEGEENWRPLVALTDIKGETGNDGHTPEIEIGEDGYWYIDSEKTDTKAEGVDGSKGSDGTTWYTSKGNPNSLNVLGKLGDFCFDKLDNEIYLHDGTTWVSQVDLTEDVMVETIDDNIPYTGEIMGRSFEVVFETLKEGEETYRSVKSLLVGGEDGLALFNPTISIDNNLVTLTMTVEGDEIVQNLILADNNTLETYVTSEELGLLKGVYEGSNGYLTLSDNTFALLDGSTKLKGTWKAIFGSVNEGYYTLKMTSGGKVFTVDLSYFYRAYYSSTHFASSEEELMYLITSQEVSEITLGGNVDLSDTLDISRKLTIDLNGYTLSAKNDTSGEGVFHVLEGGNLTIEDSNGEGVIDGVSSNEQGYHMAIWADGGNVIINGGNFTNVDVDGSDPQYDLIYVKNGGYVEINDGTFASITPRWTLNVRNDTEGTILVKGGEFLNFDPSAAYTDDNIPEGQQNPVDYVADGYVVSLKEVSEGVTVYVVTAIVEE